MRIHQGVFGVLMGIVAGPVWAGNDNGILLGNQAAMTGGAVVATVVDGSAIWYNPAGLARVEVATVDATASAFVLRTFSIPVGLVERGASGRTASGSFRELVSVPSLLSFVRPLGERLKLGLGLFTEQFSDLRLRTTLDVAGDPSVRWGLSVTQDAETYFGGVALAWQATPTLHVGASVLVGYRDVAAATQFSGGELTDAGGNRTEDFVSEALWLATTSVGVQVLTGIQWQPLERFRLGITVGSPVYQVYTSARTLTNVAQSVPPAGSSNAAQTFTLEPADQTEVAWRTALPSVYRVALAYGTPTFWVSVGGDYRPANEDNAGPERDAVVNGQVGGRWQVTERWGLGAGLFTDRSAQPRPLSFGSGRIDFYGGTVGTEYRSELSVVDATTQKPLTFSTTLALRYAYGSGEFGAFELPTIDRVGSDGVTPRDTALTSHEVTLHIGTALFF